MLFHFLIYVKVEVVIIACFIQHRHKNFIRQDLPPLTVVYSKNQTSSHSKDFALFFLIAYKSSWVIVVSLVQ